MDILIHKLGIKVLVFKLMNILGKIITKELLKKIKKIRDKTV